MIRHLPFLFIACVIVAIWAASPFIVGYFYGDPASASEAGEMFGGVNALFSGIALAGLIYTMRLQAIDVKTNQENLNKSIEDNKRSMEIMALSSLIQEADSSLSRYERWEAADKSGDYTQVKAKVRKKLNVHRDQLETLLSTVKGA